ncbi:MAG: carboxypeptidase-like regulatory domain-containing protein, partial [Thermoplasmata archaeon]
MAVFYKSGALMFLTTTLSLTIIISAFTGILFSAEMQPESATPAVHFFSNPTAPSRQTPFNGSIAGTVFIFGTPTPLSNATVLLTSGGTLPTSKKTNSSGTFYFGNLPFNVYVVYVSAKGYFFYQGNVSVSPTEPDISIEIYLNISSIIEGKVLDSQAGNLSGADVIVECENGDAINP